MQSRGVRRPSVCLSVCKLLHASRYFYNKHDSIATKLAHDGPHMDLHPRCAQDQGQRSRDTGTYVMSRKVCYTVPSDVLYLHMYALALRSTVTLSFQYKCQTARCNVHIMEWVTPSLTVWLLVLEGVQCDSKTESMESHWLSQFSRWRTNLRDHASVTLWKISLTETLVLDESLKSEISLIIILRLQNQLVTRKPSWCKGKRATAVHVWRPLVKKSTANG